MSDSDVFIFNQSDFLQSKIRPSLRQDTRSQAGYSPSRTKTNTNSFNLSLSLESETPAQSAENTNVLIPPQYSLVFTQSIIGFFFSIHI